jgi:hypothetical protein
MVMLDKIIIEIDTLYIKIYTIFYFILTDYAGVLCLRTKSACR